MDSLCTYPFRRKSSRQSNTASYLEERLIGLLSGDSNDEIDKGLEALDTLQNPEQIVKIIERVFDNKGFRLEIEGKKTSDSMSAIRMVRIGDDKVVAVQLLRSVFLVLN